MAEEELYEELGNDGPEDIYEDLPDAAFVDSVPSSPPPLPTTPIPTISPTHALQKQAAPPLPTRSAATALTSKGATMPVNQAKTANPPSGKGATMKTAKPTQPKPKASSGGGLDMSEILKKARQRTGSSSAFTDLENKMLEKKEDENAHVAPWANQLRKTSKVLPPTVETSKDTSSPPSWVKKKPPVEAPEDDEPEFLRKRKQIQGLQQKEVCDPSSDSPPLSKSPVNVANGESGDDNKPAWLKQRERQQQMAKTVNSEDKPAVVPKPAARPPPMAPKPNKAPPPTDPPAPSPRKPRPTPTPRNQDSSAPSVPPPEENSSSNTSSVMAKAKMFTEAAKPPVAPKVASKPQPIAAAPPTESPPPISPRVEKKSPTPPPIPTREASMKHAVKAPPPASLSPVLARRMASPIQEEEPPPLPTSRPPPLVVPPPPPDMPPPPTSPPPPSSQPPPPPLSHPPSSGAPPALPERNKPGPPSSRPPPSLPRGPVTQAQPTPPTGTVLKFRRRPLQSVNLSNPPPLPQRDTKPEWPFGSSPQGEDGDFPEEIYEDTLAMGMADEDKPDDDEPEDLYDDVNQIQPRPPVSGPPPVSPPLPSGPPPTLRPPIENPPLPSGPPPTTRPPPPPIEPPEANYETDPSLAQNGVNHMDQPQELYEDLHPDDSYLSTPTPAASSNSLLPPSPSPTATSPTMERKQKLSREQKKMQKEEEKKKKELKKKEEVRTKNRQKGLKTFKEYKLTNDVKSLFAVEVTEDHPKTKELMAVTKGEVCFVLLISHPKLPNEYYLAEKEDGSMGYIIKDKTQRTAQMAYQNPQSTVTTPAAATELDYADQDIYEQLPQGEEDDEFPGDAPPPALPSLPPPNRMAVPPPRFPAPSQPPPPPPPGDEPQDTYEYLGDEQGSY